MSRLKSEFLRLQKELQEDSWNQKLFAMNVKTLQDLLTVEYEKLKEKAQNLCAIHERICEQLQQVKMRKREIEDIRSLVEMKPIEVEKQLIGSRSKSSELPPALLEQKMVMNECVRKFQGTSSSLFEKAEKAIGLSNMTIQNCLYYQQILEKKIIEVESGKEDLKKEMNSLKSVAECPCIKESASKQQCPDCKAALTQILSYVNSQSFGT